MSQTDSASVPETPSAGRILVIQHQSNAGLGAIANSLESAAARIDVRSAEHPGAIPDTLAEFDGLVVLGGSMGPEDDAVAPWLPRVRDLLREGVASGVPTLGICLGAQLLAVAHGGRVTEMAHGPEIGLGTVAFTAHDTAAGEEDPLFGHFAGASVPVVQWHYLEVAALPNAARRLASSDHCPNQVFALGGAAWGVQFHPEASSVSAADWVIEDAENLERLARDAASIVSRVTAAEPELLRVWGGVAERFAAIVDARVRAQLPG